MKKARKNGTTVVETTQNKQGAQATDGSLEGQPRIWQGISRGTQQWKLIEVKKLLKSSKVTQMSSRSQKTYYGVDYGKLNIWHLG